MIEFLYTLGIVSGFLGFIFMLGNIIRLLEDIRSSLVQSELKLQAILERHKI